MFRFPLFFLYPILFTVNVELKKSKFAIFFLKRFNKTTKVDKAKQLRMVQQMFGKKKTPKSSVLKDGTNNKANKKESKKRHEIV